MSEKRFNCVLGNDYHIINDNFDNMTYFLQERNDVVKLVWVLNEQQATIEQQEQSITILKQEIADTQAILEMLSEKLKGWNNE